MPYRKPRTHVTRKSSPTTGQDLFHRTPRTQNALKSFRYPDRSTPSVSSLGKPKHAMPHPTRPFFLKQPTHVQQSCINIAEGRFEIRYPTTGPELESEAVSSGLLVGFSPRDFSAEIVTRGGEDGHWVFGNIHAERWLGMGNLLFVEEKALYSKRY